MARRAAPIDTKVLADYADIAVGLVPRVRAIAFFDLGSDALWQRGPSPPPPLQAAIVRAQSGDATAIVSVPVGGAMVGYVLPALREGRVLGACTLVIAGGASPRDAPAPSATHVAALLAPVINLLGRTLLEAETAEAAAAAAKAAAKSGVVGTATSRAAVARTGTASRLSVVQSETGSLRATQAVPDAATPGAVDSGEPTLSERTRELEWLINLSADTSSGGADNNAILVRVLRGAVERMGCVLGAVMMPDRQVNLIVHHSNAAESDAHQVLERMRPSLMDASMNRHRVVVVNQLAERGGARLPYKVIAVPVFASGGTAGAKATGVLAFLRPVARSDFERRHLYLCKHLSRQVSTLISRRFDLATGLHTRSALETHVRELAASNSPMRYGSLLHIDIDQLHLINDRHGFDRGDDLIARFAQQLQAPMLPPNAVAARLGGDQFAVFLPGLNVELAERAAHKLSGAIHAASQQALPPGVEVTASIGIAELTVDVPDLARAFICRARLPRGQGPGPQPR
jgi:diguanylate cyclase (GGDEF)-like protein